jgi:hypothetical protein
VVIEWHNRPHWQFGAGVGMATFEMLLFEDGDILYQYLDVGFGNPAYDLGASATVGIRGPTPSYYLQHSFDAPALANGLALCFDHPASAAVCGFGEVLPWLDVTPTAGTLPGGISATQPIDLLWTASPTLPGRYTGALWIANNDPAAQPAIVPVSLTVLPPPSVQFASAAYTVPESAPGAVVSVTLNVVPTQTVTVDFATSAGSATAGADYLDASGTLTFTPGLTLTTLVMPLLDDSLPEGPETVHVALSQPDPYLLGLPATATLTLLDDEPSPLVRFSQAAQSVPEGTSAAAITLLMQPASALAVTVPYTVLGSATSGVDHTLAGGAFTLLPGQVTASVSFDVAADLWYESGETIVLALGPPIHAVLGDPAQHIVTIVEVAPVSRFMFPVVFR